MNLIDDFYIIESLGQEDIKDGKIFFESLKSINDFNPKYFKVDEFEGLRKVLTEFAKSNYKYLFISTHGDEENLELNNEIVNSYDLDDIEIDLSKKRIFMSSCKGGSFLFAKYFIKRGAYSVIGTPDNLPQIVAVAMWPTMLILFVRLNNFEVNFSELDKSLKLIVRFYKITMHYYSFIKNENKMKEYIYRCDDHKIRHDYEI
ncbi:MAG: hypothetical protein JXR82_13595 [Marinifilaceae bacterium]|nr:hypothetical protein [Marinifilaceae bacterium]